MAAAAAGEVGIFYCLTTPYGESSRRITMANYSSKKQNQLLCAPSFNKIIIRRNQQFRVSANLGGGEDEAVKKDAGKKKKKFITREEEPEQYWQTAGEREGENPMKTPLPYIIIFGMSTPFVILAIAFANGWIKVPVR